MNLHDPVERGRRDVGILIGLKWNLKGHVSPSGIDQQETVTRLPVLRCSLADPNPYEALIRSFGLGQHVLRQHSLLLRPGPGRASRLLHHIKRKMARASPISTPPQSLPAHPKAFLPVKHAEPLGFPLRPWSSKNPRESHSSDHTPERRLTPHPDGRSLRVRCPFLVTRWHWR